MRSVFRPIAPETRDWPTRITVCVNDRSGQGLPMACGPLGSVAVEAALIAEVARRGIDVEIRTVRCLGLCGTGPNIRCTPGGTLFHEVSPDDAAALIDAFLRHRAAERA
ncbi:MAG: (2Fe-2S) ferredoxin domain-containing protein [Alphaproteobacteria bacterium]|nr:(2Fe-2S) ferredoxin domain-containing protein [Alphaproteobacteria bacterium]